MTRYIRIFQLGTGNVGKQIIQQVLNRDFNKNEFQLNYIGFANSSSCYIDPNGIEEKLLRNILEGQLKDIPNLKASTDVDRLGSGILSDLTKNLCIIDATDSDETVNFLEQCAERNIPMVLANKKPLVKGMELFSKLDNGLMGCSSTVGAGLAIIPKILEMQKNHIQINRIEGCFSGSLGILCSELERGIPFSKCVYELREKGYTEPDPRVDLSGHDVARKILILARKGGNTVELSDVIMQGFVPDPIQNLSLDSFLNALVQFDPFFMNLFSEARLQNKTYKFIGTFENNQCSAALKLVSKKSEFGRINGPEKIVKISTVQEFEEPIIIKGEGAGAESAARDVLKDVLAIMKP